MNIVFESTPKGATHRYQHEGETSWYRETEDNLFVWRDGSWYVSTQKSAADLAKVCPFGAVTILTQEVQLANDSEDDLTWLARNVHEWPAGADFVRIHTNGNEPVFVTKIGASLGGNPFTRDQWLGRRAELQNKPSWDSTPSNAEWRAQHSTGYWCWGRGTATQATNGIWYSPEFGTAQWTGCAGEVLGDWRDTLERRPDHTRAEMEVELVKAGFEPFTSIEGNQEFPMSKQQETQQDNGWFERGELPPVGTVCEHVGPATGKIQRVVVVAVHHFIGEAIWSHRENGGRLFYGMRGCFRPIRTERELAVDEMMKCTLGVMNQETQRRLFEDLYDAGYRKETK